MHFLGGLQGVGSLPGPTTFAAGRPAYHIVRVATSQTLVSLQWSHDLDVLMRMYRYQGMATGKGEYIVRLPTRPRYNGAIVVYPMTHRGWVVMEEAGKYSIQPPGTTPLGGGTSAVLDESAVGGPNIGMTIKQRTEQKYGIHRRKMDFGVHGLDAGPAISPFQPRAGSGATPATSQPAATQEVRDTQAKAWGEATAGEQRDAAIMKWGPPIAVIGAVSLIAAWWFLGRK